MVQHNIRVNATGVLDEVFHKVASDAPLGRLIDLQNVADLEDLVLFLLSDQPVMITYYFQQMAGSRVSCRTMV